MIKFKILLLCLALTACSGCAIISALGTPTRAEKKVPAEFNLANYNSGKVAIIITSNPDNEQGKRIRNYLSKSIKSFIIVREIVTPENIIPYGNVYNLVPSPVPDNDDIVVRIASQLGAKTAIKVKINKYKLENLASTEYYEGSLSVSSSILDTATGQNLWPQGGFGKDISVSFDIESKGHEAAAIRLANTAAHCVTRYWFDCPMNGYKIYEESISLD